MKILALLTYIMFALFAVNCGQMQNQLKTSSLKEEKTDLYSPKNTAIKTGFENGFQ
ncbi:MAG: hypothetical protein IPL24_12555 [Bacteroidetes bacterium]|nr:hypothetical protein [Bacteroidota bacterium]